MSSGSTLSLDAYLAAGIPLIVLCAGFVGLRCWMNFRVYRRFLVADYLSILGWAFVTIAFAMNHVIIQKFINPSNPNSLPWLNRMAIVITIIVALELFTTKVPILLVYIQLFRVHAWLTYTCYACIVFSGLAYTCFMAPTFIKCPGPAETVAALQRCTAGTTLTGAMSAFVALAQDVVIFGLPMPIVRSLQMPRAKKVVVGAVFFSGVLGIAASIASLYFKWRAYKGMVSDTLATMLCAVIEGTIAIMIGCAPAMKQFWSKIVIPGHSRLCSSASRSSSARTTGLGAGVGGRYSYTSSASSPQPGRSRTLNPCRMYSKKGSPGIMESDVEVDMRPLRPTGLGMGEGIQTSTTFEVVSVH
ncbi:hypothetical protein BDW74DRAFT_185450 [Aspergillus multicolor]|uniref:uncharacterized protein n=1 Tax=Aspergillus multicolor TaxID=41759 RepID=UPI003CCCE6E9